MTNKIVAGSIAGALSLFAFTALSAPLRAADTIDVGSLATTPIRTATAMLDAVTSPVLSIDPSVLDGEEQPDAPEAALLRPATLEGLVAAHASSDTIDAEHECLAASVYFEAKGEPLSGQLAVAQTVLNRAVSGRFPTSACGVVRQRGQFSFVRGGAVPSAPRTSTAWKHAVAVALIARDDLWQDMAPDSLYFHATRVAPRWVSAKRIARLGNHVFYR